MTNKRKNLILLLLAAAVVILILVSIAFMGTRQQDEKTVIGFVTLGSAEDAGWNISHINGITQACEDFDVELILKENVSENAAVCRKAVQELIDEGASVIILNSYNYASLAADLIKKHPEITFFADSSNGSVDRVTPYFVRMYQARYLAGILAGGRTENGRIGYVAAMENTEVIRGINAFTLGVQSVNPDAEVYVIWTGSWSNAERETECTRILAEDVGVDLVTYHQDEPNVVQTADELGIYSIAYNGAVDGCSDKCLAAVEGNWTIVYEQLLTDYFRKQISDNYWIGLEKDAVEITAYSDLVTQEETDCVNAAMEQIRNGRDVFSGVIYDADGRLRCAEGEMLSDKTLLEEMNWFVKGVQVYEE